MTYLRSAVIDSTGVRDSARTAHTHAPSHANNVGCLRLAFALLVIASHVPAMVDGDARREPLKQVGAAISLGEVAVACFFILSGYLITASYQHSRSARDYMLRRAARIYPAFIVVSLLCVFVQAPIGGGQLALSDPQFWIQMLRRITLLQPPRVDGAFEEIVWRTLNGSTWTIGYEFRCYLLVVVLGLCGVLRRPGLLMALFIGILMSNFWVLNSAIQLPQPALWLAALVGRPDASLQLTSYFLAGAVLWSVPSVLASCRRAYPLLAFPLAASLATPAWADLGLATVGAIVVIALALDDRPAARWMRHVNARQDVSYGVYLYAWPCTAILIHLAPGLGLNALLMATVALSLLFGAMSWFCVERPVLNLVRARRG